MKYFLRLNLLLILFSMSESAFAQITGPAGVTDSIQLWLDGSNVNNSPGTNPADTTKITVWKDISGKGHDATVLAGQDTARMNTNQINGKDVVQFTGSSFSLGSVYEVAGVDIRGTAMPKTTIFTVYRQTPFAAGSLQGIWGNDNANWDRFFMSSYSGTTGIVSVGPPASFVSIPNAGTMGATKLLTAVYHNGVTDSSVIYFNGAPVSRVTDNSSLTDAQSNLRIGWDGDNNPFTGDIAEMVVYNRKLTDCEIIAVNRYFGFKYGVTLSTAVVTPSAAQFLCTGGSVLLTSSTGISYKWLKDGAVIASATSSTYSASSTGKYSVIVENSGGCFDTSAATTVFVGSRLYVDSSIAVSGTGESWSGPLKTVTEALTAANEMTCDVEIWVKKGTYYPMAGTSVTTSRDSSFRVYRNNIKLYGGFAGTETAVSDRIPSANTSILSGDIGIAGDSTDNSYHVLTIVATPSKQIDTNTIVDGFTVTRGNANGSGTFTGNTIAFYRSDGGGLLCIGMTTGNKCNPLVENCIISRNSATFGGGLYNAAHDGGQSSPLMRACSLSDNHAFSQGGGFHSWGDGAGPVLTAYFTNCIFQANTTATNGAGGSIRMNSSTAAATHIFTNCSFISNNASPGNGGGINYESNATAGPTFNNCTFTGNLATWGGGYYISNTAGTTLSNCTFTANQASYVGGAILASNSNITINHTNFNTNYAASFGAGICHPFSTARSLNINACSFTGNNTPNNGGGIYTQNGVTVNIDSSNFTGNKAYYGGCLLASNAGYNISNSTFNSDTATFGSIIRSFGPDTSTITNCRFLNNYSNTQGGIENAGGAYLSITKCVFFNNKAFTNAPAILNYNTASVTNITNCVLANNSTSNTGGGGGGAIDIQQGKVILNNTTLSDNTTASTVQPNTNSIWAENGATLTLNNSIVWGGAAQHVGTSGTVTTSYNYSLVKGLALTAPNLSSDPQFVNASDADGSDNIWGTSDDGLKTYPCSPTRNAGLNSLVPGTLTADFASDTRIQYVNVDMGAYEHNDTAMSIPDIAITANPGNVICAGTLVNFPTTLAGTGSAPTYKWFKNGTVVSTASSYSSTALIHNDTIWVVMTNTDCNLSDTSAKIIMTVAAPVIYVDSSVASSGAGTSWATAYKTVTEALNVANATPATCAIEIWVKKGTYYPHPSARDSSFRIARNNIKLYGGFAGGESTLSARSVSTNPTILSGNLGTVTDSTDNSYHVLTIIARAPSLLIDTNTIVDGFTITGGNGYLMSGSYTYAGVTMNRQDGGGILINGVGSGNKCSPLINNCIITRNSANFGGGMYIAAMSTGSTSPILRNTSFITNRANNNGGGVFNNTQLTGVNVLTIENCKFTANLAANGAGLFNQGGSGGNITGTVINTTFESNSATNGGGIYNAGNCAISYTGNTFNSNNASVGGSVFNNSTATLTYISNIFTSNTATTSGGAIQSTTGTINLNLCVFAGNSASGGSAGAYQNESSASTTFTNCLLVNNTAAGVSADAGGAIKNTAGTVNLNSSTLYNNSTASTTKPNGNTITTLSGSTTNITNTIIWGSATTHIDAAGTVNYSYALVKGASLSAPSLSIDPRFVNPSNPIGADNIWLTADDGLELIPCSPAVNAATTSPATDIRNRTRFGLPDMGAYEEQTGIIPTPPVVSSPVTYCQNAIASALTATKSSASDTLKWYNATPTLLAGAPTPLTTTAGTTTYYVSQTNATGCESAKSTINVVVNPAATAPTVTTPVTYCQGVTALALTATAASSSDTLKWYNAALTPLAAAPTPSTATVGSTDYWVSAKSSLGCEGNKTKITVVVNPTPALPTSASPIVYCQGFPAVPLTATAASASDTLRWFDATPTLLSGAPTPSTATVGSTTYYVSQKNSFACEGAKRTITVMVNTTPAAPAAPSPVTYCQDEISVALTGTKASPSDTLKWYNAALAPLASAPIPATTTPGTYTFYVSDKTSLGCEGPKTTVTVQVNPRPAAPTVVTPIDLCVGVPASPLAATGINLKWYTLATGGTSSPTLTPAIGTVGAITYYVSQTSLLNCEGPRAALTVNVRPSPVVTVTTMTAPAFVFCVGDSVALKAISATAISYQWYRNTITMPGSTRDTLTVNTTADYGVIAKNIYGCADTETVSVIRNPLPVPHLSPEDVNICDGIILMLYASPARSGYKYEWFKDGLTMGIDTAESKTPVNLSGGYTIRVTDIYGCVLTTNVASVNTYPVLPTPTIVMVGGVLNLTLSYASYQWYRNGKAILGATGSSHVPTFDGIYTVKVNDINGCDATSGEFSVQNLGIREQNSGNKSVSLYPNPTQNKVSIEASEKVNLKVTDITGKLILQTENATEADLQNYADGIYMFYITDTEGNLLLTQKVWKKN
ncbi:MAG: choice-of-anchor Q domain-containing protein [Chitinophagaceae bacterium]|jgi:predicted outer membrane repeat protein